ncbi:hypothetical protein GGF38_000628, partial [Coemansia sp. RSA 25]
MLGGGATSSSKSTAGGKHANSSSPGSSRIIERSTNAVKWEIAQDKALLSGVRKLRWELADGEQHRTAEEARDPSRFVEDDWSRISREVSNTGQQQRSARHCRRRWAWLHAHLGAAIMDFVDTSPTPQSSAQSTPVVPRDYYYSEGGVPTHIRNLRLADLPRSSPPIHPVRLRESRVDSTPSNSVQNTPVLDPLREGGAESRWDDPAYCQLLADVVQAMSDPQSRAAKVARMFAATAAAAPDTATKAMPTAIPPVVSAPIFASAPISIAPPVAPAVAVPPQPGVVQLMPQLMIAPPPPVVPPFSDLPAIAGLVTSSSGLPLFSSEHHHPGGARLANAPLPLPSAAKSPAVTAVADDLTAHGPMDQDLSMYMQFLQSLASDHIDLGSAWSTLFEDTSVGGTALSVAPSIAGLGPMTVSVCDDVPAKLAANNDKAAKKSGGSAGGMASIEDDDMDDGDFVLDEEEEEDDDYEDDVDDDDADYTEGVSRPASGSLRPLGHGDGAGPARANGQQQALLADGNGISDGAWSLALSELGLGSPPPPMTAAGMALPFVGDGHGGGLFAPDPLLQQLMQGVADLGQRGAGGGGSGGGGSGAVAASGEAQSAWLPSAAADSAMLPQWSASGGGVGATAAPPQGAAARAKEGAQARRGQAKAPRKRHSAITVGSSSYKKALLAAERAGAGMAAAAAAAAAAADADGQLGLGPGEAGSGGGGLMDTEMTGLYQDALQEGEALDVQEEAAAQAVDGAEYLFMADHMAQLRAQQLMNFQLVVQAFLIACAELGPHAPRARHWRRQLDQLALWHSLGTRESPTDLVSSEGLARFARLIASAEQQQQQQAGGGMTEFGKLPPNPASFFAIPGITAIIPDIYEAVDEIHRAAHVAAAAADADTSGGACEVRSLNGAMEFTPRCACTAVRGFKSAMVLECVFPRLHLQLRNGKRKPDAGEPAEGGAAAAAGAGAKRQAAGDAQPALLQAKPVVAAATTTSRPALGTTSSSSASSHHLPTLMPQVVADILPSCTQADQRAIIDEIRTHMRTFKRDLHRVPRYRRRVYLQGDDGVPRLDWIQVKIQPLGFPPAMQCVMAPLLAHCGFQESMLPQIIMVRKPKNRIHFLESEDALLLLGLRLFGIEDLASVRVHLMPCKTASQLRNRMNNLRARRQAPNAIKDFCLRRIAPFTLEEEEILRVGVLVYGD